MGGAVGASRRHRILSGLRLTTMSPISEALFNGLYDGGSRQRRRRPENNPGTRSPPFPQTLSTGPRFPPRATTALHPQVLGHFFFFLSWRKSARTPGRFWGEAGLQPTKTSTMAVPAVIERDPRNGVSDTPPPPTAQNASHNGAVCGHIIPRLVGGAAVQGSLVPVPDCLAVSRR